ncbi:MAG: lipoyl(octanoyl) transferase LipB [Candidatus Spechtbacteria bacterium]|nr:lipoyl(octanoyl) transferase LipB [Candidatus Spechtbacteria bacterium]
MLTWLWLGLYDFLEMLELQERLFLNKQQGDDKNYLIFAEHSPVYTYDERKPRDHLWRLPKPASVPLIHAPRAGSITYHGPGQLVCYCILDLKTLDLDGPLALNWVIEETIIRTLAEFGIVGHRRKEPVAAQGVWVTGSDGVERKIASRGISTNKGIARFGFALNVTTELSYFDYIYPCGINIQMTSVYRECRKYIDLNAVARLLVYHFEKVIDDRKEAMPHDEIAFPPAASARLWRGLPASGGDRDDKK